MSATKSLVRGCRSLGQTCGIFSSTTSLPELYGRKKKAKTTSTMSRIAYVVRSILGVFGCLYQYWLASVDATFSCLVACVIFSAWPNACKKGPSARLSRNARFELRNSARPGACTALHPRMHRLHPRVQAGRRGHHPCPIPLLILLLHRLALLPQSLPPHSPAAVAPHGRRRCHPHGRRPRHPYSRRRRHPAKLPRARLRG